MSQVVDNLVKDFLLIAQDAEGTPYEKAEALRKAAAAILPAPTGEIAPVPDDERVDHVARMKKAGTVKLLP